MSPVRIKDNWREQRIFVRRVWLVIALMVVAAIAVFTRLYYLQVVRQHYYEVLSVANGVRTVPIPAARGLIVDRDGEIMASNRPTFALELTPDEVPDLRGSLERLARLGLLHGNDIPHLIRAINSHLSFDPVPIRLQLSESEVARFAVRRYEFPGINISPQQSRWYPLKNLGVFAIGYVGPISASELAHINQAAYAGTALIGKSGIEAQYEKILHGTNGYRQVLVNALGREVRRPGVLARQLHEKPPVPGKDVIVSLNLKIQRLAEKLLKGQDGAVVALNPWNGNVIALVSSPTFNPNLFTRGISEKQYLALVNNPDNPLFDRALRSQLPIGSTIKPAIALGALTDGVLNPTKRIYAGSDWHLPGSDHMFHNYKHEVCGRLGLNMAIIMSCDVYFYQVAYKMGIERIGTWLPNFGFGRPTGIDLPGEESGLVPTPAWMAKHYPHGYGWYPGDTVILGIGQGDFMATPIQLAHYTAILATRGLSFRPRLVTGVRNPLTHKIHWKRPVLDGNLTMISRRSWRVVIKAMHGVTTNPRGTAYWDMINATYPIAAKTGTAQLTREQANGDYNLKATPMKLRDDSWFITFAPLQKPRIAIAVLVEHAGAGALAAGPIAMKILNAYLLGPNGKLLPATPRARYSMPRGIEPRIVAGVDPTLTPTERAAEP